MKFIVVYILWYLPHNHPIQCSVCPILDKHRSHNANYKIPQYDRWNLTINSLLHHSHTSICLLLLDCKTYLLKSPHTHKISHYICCSIKVQWKCHQTRFPIDHTSQWTMWLLHDNLSDTRWQRMPFVGRSTLQRWGAQCSLEWSHKILWENWERCLLRWLTIARDLVFTFN